MTRFARAKGSKASNERLPETSTPWNAMKQDLHKSQEEFKNRNNRKKNDEERQKNYNEFVEEQESKKEKKWAEFPKNLKTIKKKNKNLLKITEKDVTDDMIEEMCHPDPQIDGKLKNMTKQIENVLTKKKNKNKQVSEEKPKDNNDEAPEEAPATVAPKSAIIKKAKNKKKALKIPAANNNNAVAIAGKTQNSKKENKQTLNKKFKNKTVAPKSPVIAEENKDETQNPKKENKQTLNKKFKNKNQEEKFDKNIKNNNQKDQKRKLPKQRDDKEHKRRKPTITSTTIRINGEETKINLFKGFPVLEDDYNQLVELEKSLVSKGIPRSEIQRTMLTQRRKAERTLSRLKKHVCYQCRETGHVLSDCPQVGEKSLVDTTATGICYKCGSTEHSHRECKISKEYKFAKCFICKEQGHISNQCPDNPRGLYPKGGACKICGDVTHLRKDCPTFKNEQKDTNSVFLSTSSDGNIESIEEEDTFEKKSVSPNKKKIVKF